VSAQATAADVLRGAARWCVVEGDAADVLRSLPDARVDALVTDPPSGIAFMGAEWDRNKGGRAQWVAWLAGILADCRRATREGGRSVVWSLPRTSHWTGSAVEDAGWAIETTIAHLFGTGWPKGASQLKPAQETWWLARNGRSEPLQVDACRVGAQSTRGMGSGRTRAWEGGALAGAETGSDAGRWPANLLLSHADGCVCEGTRRVTSRLPGGVRRTGAGVTSIGEGMTRGGTSPVPLREGTAFMGDEDVEAWRCVEGCPVLDLDRQSGESGGARVRVNRRDEGRADESQYRSKAMAGTTRDHGDTGTASRFFPQFPADDPDAPWSEALFRYVAKPSRAERNVGCEGLPLGAKDSTYGDGFNSATKVCTASQAAEGVDRGLTTNHHPTVKSVALMRWLIRLVTKPGDVVLDPFGGSGTTGVAALLEGRRVVLVEREPAFAAIIRARCAAADGAEWSRPIAARVEVPSVRRPDASRQLALFDGGAA
jgi:site-specific DNA-methyltransferase (adenine-specific)